MLRLWNTASRSLEEFKPINPPKVGLYTCGPTVYWDAHIGNMRSYVFEDILQRTLELEGFDVTRVMNITDVGHLTTDQDEGEDKIEVTAAKTGKTAQEIAETYTRHFLDDAAKLNIKIPAPPFLCKATENIKEQIELIQQLEKKGFTYATSDGIYFDTSKFPSYGRLSGQRLEEKEEGARVAANPEKKHKTDFALWKFSNPSDDARRATPDARPKRQQEWESPWGIGFPGWHVECSAMSRKYLGQPFDIHCGGVDHISVHHENEIAQSEAAYGVKLANYWMHNEFLLVDGQKMSKSLGNFYTVRDLEAKGFDPLALRYLYLGTHYRQKQNFTWDALTAAQNALTKLRGIVRDWDDPSVIPAQAGTQDQWMDSSRRRRDGNDNQYLTLFKSALEDDLNTPIALASLWKLVDDPTFPTKAKAATILFMDRILGLSLEAALAKPVEVPVKIKELVRQREDARTRKDWKTSDTLRAEIEERGWIVEDTSDGTKIRKK